MGLYAAVGGMLFVRIQLIALLFDLCACRELTAGKRVKRRHSQYVLHRSQCDQAYLESGSTVF